MKKQLTMSLISDELGQASTKKSSVIRKLVPSKRATSEWYFGYKEHIGVDADSGLVHTVETTAAILY